MVKRVVWTSRADRVFTGILEFYVRRNASKAYSRKINNEINKLLNLLKKHPFLGKKTDIRNVRVVFHHQFKIFYRIDSSERIVLLIWDTRQDPKDLKL